MLLAEMVSVPKQVMPPPKPTPEPLPVPPMAELSLMVQPVTLAEEESTDKTASPAFAAAADRTAPGHVAADSAVGESSRGDEFETAG